MAEVKEEEKEVESCGLVCTECGNADFRLFIRTGTCHACQVCGASMGCS